MELELLKALKKNDKAAVLPLWSEVPSVLIAKYTFKLESNAATHGFPLQRCQLSWAAGLLLFETHKHRSNRARNKASVVERENNSRISENQVSVEFLQSEVPSLEYANLYCGDEFEDSEDEIFSEWKTTVVLVLLLHLFPLLNLKANQPSLSVQEEVTKNSHDLK
ncbi:uncharacterized protein B0P05DRAFT_640627 [Gilbertella persicaria]|uniref:uncharacterized protein n=1 Tax=Gilbertella persicaria TaxID=101096 RepID=UPI00221F031E|nr:uncharacterized protein B0P05DRAFT_640627 [Gilbertella persicaria]KAI8060620.1 hypothetical protein B0P05DRAFT_640627 [Gilbertella persicaria]